MGNFAPVVGVTAALLAVTSEFENSSGAPVSLQNSVFVKTYEELEGQMATYQQMMQDNVGFQRTLIAGDANLLQAVAAMVGGELWLIEDTAALSTGRQQFTQWVYQGFASKLYTFWDVTYCNNEASVH